MNLTKNINRKGEKMTIKEYLQERLPKRTIEVDDATYPGSIMIFIDSVSFPLLANTNDFEALWKTLQTYCFSFADCLGGNNEKIIDDVINQIISIDNTEAYVNLNDLDKLATAIESQIADHLKHNDSNYSLAQLALLQKIADELRFDNAAEAMNLIKDKKVGYVLHFKHLYEPVAFQLAEFTLDEYESADIYSYLNESPKALGELIKDAAAEFTK